MSAKRPSLADSMRAAAVAPQPAPAPREPISAAKPVVVAKPEQTGFYAATRAGKKKATAPLSGEAHRQLKTLAAEQGGTVEGLLLEAINDLFRKHGKPAIA